MIVGRVRGSVERFHSLRAGGLPVVGAFSLGGLGLAGTVRPRTPRASSGLGGLGAASAPADTQRRVISETARRAHSPDIMRLLSLR